MEALSLSSKLNICRELRTTACVSISHSAQQHAADRLSSTRFHRQRPSCLNTQQHARRQSFTTQTRRQGRGFGRKRLLLCFGGSRGRGDEEGTLYVDQARGDERSTVTRVCHNEWWCGGDEPWTIRIRIYVVLCSTCSIPRPPAQSCSWCVCVWSLTLSTASEDEANKERANS